MNESGSNMFGDDLLWFFAILMLAGGGFGFGGNRPPMGGVSESDLYNSQNAQTQQLQMGSLQQQLSDNRFDIVQTINQQTSELNAQNNANLINAIQGFNNLGLQITNQTNTISSQLQALDAKLTQCCCEIKTQMLQDKLSDAQAKIVAQQAELSNAAQTQTILSTMGRWVGWATSGSVTPATNG